MKYTDLDLRELLRIEDGMIHFANERSVIISTNALGILRKELVHLLGFHASMGVFLRLGFAHGWRTAERLQQDFPWDDKDEWRKAGGRLHALQGHVVVEVPKWSGLRAEPFAHATWRDSYEAEQHLRHLGQATEPVCWTLTGFVSGYLSCVNGRRVIALETHCRALGDTVCCMEARFEDEWGDQIRPILSLIDSPCLVRGLDNAARALIEMEQRIVASKGQQLEELRAHDGRIVARSAQMKHAIELAKQVARVDSVVLITGESGSGKERIAQMIHSESARMKGPFLAVNCGAVTESLLESELFGHVRGAFTGAIQDRTGLFEAARGGTLFLDEVGELPATMQVKLLRVLQERQVRRVGENRAREVDVRLIAATNRNLVEEVARGNFREDLFYRLKVIHLPIPALRSRKDDVMPIARFFLEKLCRRLGRQGLTGFSPSAADLLLKHDWPGNVRELENAVEHAVVLAPGPIVEPADLPLELRASTPVAPAASGGTLAEVERRHILATLAAVEGNQTRAAKQLGIGTATLYRKLREYRQD